MRSHDELPSTSESVEAESTRLANRLLREAEAKAAVRLNAQARAFYTWCLKLSQQRGAESDALVAVVCGAKVWAARTRLCWCRWQVFTALTSAWRSWKSAAKLTVQATAQLCIALRHDLRRSILLLRAALSHCEPFARTCHAHGTPRLCVRMAQHPEG